MKAIMVEDVVKVTREPSDEAISIMSLKKGDIVETGKVTRKKKSSWVQVILPGGQTGYISGQTRIFVIRQVELAAETNLLSAPAETAAILKSLPKGSILSATGVVDGEGGKWYKVTDASNNEGYIPGRSKYRMYQEATVSGGTRLMITGGIFTALGILFLVTSFNQQTASSTTFLTVGLIALGVVQLVQGFLQLRRAKRKAADQGK